MSTFPPLDIVASLEHPKLFKPWFQGDSWNGWRAVLRAAFALPMTSEEIAFFKSIAGDREPPKHRVRELWCICGRRAGKDSVASVIAAHAAASFSPTGILRPGERALVACIAPDRETGKIVQRYVDSYFDGIPPLSLMKKRTVNSDGLVELTNSVDIAVMSNDFRLTRGRPVLCAVLDELAYMRSENTSKPDAELYTAILPGMATIPQAMMIGISSPRGKSGLLYKKWREYFGVDDDNILVIQAPSHTLNPVLDTRDRDRQIVEDPSAARAEWYAEWRDDLVAFIDPVVVDRCVVQGRTELMPVSGVTYTAAVDPSGGSSDSMTLAIAHAEGDRGILDVVREWQPPFSPDQVVKEITDIAKGYGIHTVIGDAYGGEWPRERFRVHGIDYQLAGMSRSECYLTMLPALNTPARIELLDKRRLISQLCGLERRVARSGRDSVDHPRGGHDDVINAAALALVNAALAPRSSADNWIEYYKRLAIEAGLDPVEIENGTSMIGVDVDDVRAGDSLSWCFRSQEDYLRVRVPQAFVRDRQIYFAGKHHNIMPHGDLGPVIDVLKQDVPALLKTFPAIAALNAEIACG